MTLLFPQPGREDVSWYISQKNGGELLAQLEKDAILGVGRVFFSKSDEIKSLFDSTIQEVGL